MTVMGYRDLRYVRVVVDDLAAAAAFATDGFGLQAADRDASHARFRSDARNYSLCFSSNRDDEAVALTVASEEDLAAVEARLNAAGHATRRLSGEEAAVREVKAGLVVRAPNGVPVEIVLRPLTSGWRYHGPRDAGITELQAVSLACTDIAANEAFWAKTMGLRITDWAGDAVFLALDDAHHRVALYPSRRDGILGVTWAVESKDNVMVNWYHFQKLQVPVVAGPGRQPTSGALFVTIRGPGGLLMSYAAETEAGPQIAARGPRQFADVAASHCAWGSPTDEAEFLGRSMP